MINSIKGKIILLKNNYIVVETYGVGYKLFVGSYALELKEGQEIFLWTYQVVRENALELFGFKTLTDLEVFELLIGISGIGPKVGLSIMDVTTPESLKRAVISENTDELTKVSGIGKKNAQKIIIELKNKIDKIELIAEEKSFDVEVYETLEALGFSRVDIREALKEVEEIDGDKKIKEALKILGQKK